MRCLPCQHGHFWRPPMRVPNLRAAVRVRPRPGSHASAMQLLRLVASVVSRAPVAQAGDGDVQGRLLQPMLFRCSGRGALFPSSRPGPAFVHDAGAHGRSWRTLRAELDKCVLLCRNCHAELHSEQPVKGGRQPRQPHQDLAHVAAHNAAVGTSSAIARAKAATSATRVGRTAEAARRAKISSDDSSDTRAARASGAGTTAVSLRCAFTTRTPRRSASYSLEATYAAGARSSRRRQMHPRVPKLPRRHPCRAPRPSSSPASSPTHINGRYVKLKNAGSSPSSVHSRSHRQCGNVEKSAVANCALFRGMGRLTALSDVSRAHNFPLAPSTERN